MTKPVTYEATRRCVSCYGILQRNHNVLWATCITNGYIHVPDCRDFGQFPTLAQFEPLPPPYHNNRYESSKVLHMRFVRVDLRYNPIIKFVTEM